MGAFVMGFLPRLWPLLVGLLISAGAGWAGFALHDRYFCPPCQPTPCPDLVCPTCPTCPPAVQIGKIKVRGKATQLEVRDLYEIPLAELLDSAVLEPVPPPPPKRKRRKRR